VSASSWRRASEFGATKRSLICRDGKQCPIVGVTSKFSKCSSEPLDLSGSRLRAALGPFELFVSMSAEGAMICSLVCISDD
jgi:hypothetical protein